MPNNGSNNKAHNISNISTFTNMRGYCTNGSDWRTIPFAGAINTISDIQITCDTTYIYTRTNTNMSAYNAFIILEYTKTTDTVSTRNLQTISIPENDGEGEIVRGEET